MENGQRRGIDSSTTISRLWIGPLEKGNFLGRRFHSKVVSLIIDRHANWNPPSKPLSSVLHNFCQLNSTISGSGMIYDPAHK